ncbi:SgcJ/EcaC family oxidoreductase [Mesorhizobium sp. PAMC28654]|uniref:YybH family protein n=1 Tax=Mesorhizobium sp. PAMC28654 TaxID=2880934 RepID=UPI001D0B1DBA|nr:SgcJ/EcaC family oxidoreductase [Mesorhizobium sp. PAMC28654]UDL89396.1 SgcJ/EcaC family oxidoreductase [Mesorhizobium sp. PAMC28654]
MSDHELKQLIEAADRAITAEDFEALMGFYAEDATLVVKPGLNATGKAQIHRAFVAIADHFNHQIKVRQGAMKVIEGGDSALVIMETVLDTVDAHGIQGSIVRRATYVFRKDAHGKWLCVIDNSYGTALLDA